MAYFKLLPEAEKDLESIWRFSAKNWGIEQAHRYIDALDEVFHILADAPLISPERNEFTPSVHIHHHAHHLIVFMLSKRGINIVRVLHESMDIESQI